MDALSNVMTKRNTLQKVLLRIGATRQPIWENAISGDNLMRYSKKCYSKEYYREN